MPRGKTVSAEQIIAKLREAEVELARGKKVPEGETPCELRAQSIGHRNAEPTNATHGVCRAAYACSALGRLACKKKPAISEDSKTPPVPTVPDGPPRRSDVVIPRVKHRSPSSMV
jgi:hypothetical protein